MLQLTQPWITLFYAATDQIQVQVQAILGRATQTRAQATFWSQMAAAQFQSQAT